MKTETQIRIFVEVSKTDHRKVEFDEDRVTGRQIKAAAGVPIETDLAARREGKLELVTDDETITIKNGDHFVVLPIGSIS
jgi:multiubiquitin